MSTRNDVNEENISEAAKLYQEDLAKLTKLACNPNTSVKYIKMDDKVSLFFKVLIYS